MLYLLLRRILEGVRLMGRACKSGQRFKNPRVCFFPFRLDTCPFEDILKPTASLLSTVVQVSLHIWVYRCQLATYICVSRGPQLSTFKLGSCHEDLEYQISNYIQYKTQPLKGSRAQSNEMLTMVLVKPGLPRNAFKMLESDKN